MNHSSLLLAPTEYQVNFDPTQFHTVDDLNDAIYNLDAKVTRRNVLKVLGELAAIEKFKALELFLAGSTLPLEKWLISSFPTTIERFKSSLEKQILERLRDFFHFEPLPLGSEAYKLRSVYQIIGVVPNALDLLLVTISEDGTNSNGQSKVKYNHSFKTRRASRATVASSVDLSPFNILGEPVPTSRSEAEEVVGRVLGQQKEFLKYYLDILRRPEVGETIKDSFVRVETGTSAPEIGSLRSVQTSSSVNHAAYPTIQPMEAAFHFENVQGFGEWHIMISGRMDGDLRTARKREPEQFKIIVKKIKELSRGHFSDDNQKRLNGNGSGPEIPIFEAKMGGDSRLIYMVDCVPDDEVDVERQVLRLFGVYTHAQLGHGFWNTLGRQLAKRGKAYRNRCVYRTTPKILGDKVFSPAMFPTQEEESHIPDNTLDLPREDLDELHELLVLGKFHVFSQALLNSIIADLDVTFPFDVSPQERHIINHTSSCYVLGRSGTGKTTAMLYKMIGLEFAFRSLDKNKRRPRQLFVTQSSKLAEKVDGYFTKLTDSISSASQTLTELRSIAITRKRMPGHGMSRRKDSIHNRDDLPKRFSLLSDEHFPLFVTFNQLCELLEADFYHLPASDDGSQPPLISRPAESHVSYQNFLRSYWPCFPQSLTKGLDPALVFSELIGVICGSEGALHSPMHHLDQDTYENLSYRAFSTFTSQRSIIYGIFLAYLKAKHQWDHYDSADRTHALLHALRERGVPGRKVDFIYVDEVQDNLMIDALLLRSICRNPDGQFWAGDTAQTIWVGSSFRFNELKAFLYRVENQRKRMAIEHIPIATQPRVFQLTVNYRSHGGIINCAYSIIQLIEMFWPDSIDILYPERGLVDGAKPIFLSGWNEDFEFKEFLAGDAEGSIEFGHEQCILVRDEDAKREFEEQMGKIGIIMTIYESKGLEFNDVLLYNFFQDSAVDYQKWRIVLAAKEGIPAPDLGAHHISVCSELKCLYVAITRARRNLWIADCSDKGDPIRIIWSSKCQIQHCTPHTGVPRLAKASSQEDWAAQGHHLFEHQRFDQARHCFERANCHWEAAFSHAHFLYEDAKEHPVNPTQPASRNAAHAFLNAANKFFECANDPPRSELRYTCIHNAADCFEHAGNIRRAAQLYFETGNYNKACSLYRQRRMFDEACAIVKSHRSDMDSQVVYETINDAYLKRHDLECVFGCLACVETQDTRCKLFGKANELFASAYDELAYLKGCPHRLAQAVFMSSLPDLIATAADLCVQIKEYVHAIKFYIKDGSKSSMCKASRVISDELWLYIPFGISTNYKRPYIVKLFDLASQLDMTRIDTVYRDEILVFQEAKTAVAHKEFLYSSKLASLGTNLHRSKQIALALFSFDHYFARPINKDMTAQEISDILVCFTQYLASIRQVVLNNELGQDNSLQRLFGFHPWGITKKFLIQKRSLLRSVIIKSGSIKFGEMDEGITVKDVDLCCLLKDTLINRLHDRTLAMIRHCEQSRASQVCLHFAIFQKCNKGDKCYYEHYSRSMLDKPSYNLRVRIHVQQLQILRVVSVLVSSTDQELRLKQRVWIERLREALNPPHHLLGAPSLLDRSLIPELDLGIVPLEYCIQSEIRGVHNVSPEIWALQRGANLGCLDRHRADNYVSWAKRVVVSVSFEFPSPSAYMLAIKFPVNQVPATVGSEIVQLVGDLIEKRVPVHIDILCDLVERLCAWLMLHSSIRRHRVLHDIILPFDWLSDSLNDDLLAEQEDASLSLFVDSVVKLLKMLHTDVQTDFLWFHDRSLMQLSDTIYRQIFAARMCRVLAIIGVNEYFVARIYDTLASLPETERSYWLSRHYMHARNRVQLVYTLVRDSSSKGLIRLLHSRKVKRSYALPSIRDITHTRFDDIQSFLTDNRLDVY